MPNIAKVQFNVVDGDVGSLLQSDNKPPFEWNPNYQLGGEFINLWATLAAIARVKMPRPLKA